MNPSFCRSALGRIAFAMIACVAVISVSAVAYARGLSFCNSCNKGDCPDCPSGVCVNGVCQSVSAPATKCVGPFCRPHEEVIVNVPAPVVRVDQNAPQPAQPIPITVNNIEPVEPFPWVLMLAIVLPLAGVAAIGAFAARVAFSPG